MIGCIIYTSTATAVVEKEGVLHRACGSDFAGQVLACSDETVTNARCALEPVLAATGRE